MTTNTLYILTAITIVLIIVFLYQYYYNRSYVKYSNDDRIVVRTANGVIKIRQVTVADDLISKFKGLSKHSGVKDRTGKYSKDIDTVISNLVMFLKHNKDAYLSSMEKTDPTDAALVDMTTFDVDTRNAAYKTILEEDDKTFDVLYQNRDEDKFVYLLKNVDQVIKLLKKEVCSGGMIDVYLLEDLLYKLDYELTYSPTNEFYSPTGIELSTGNDPVIMKKLPPFAFNVNPMESMTDRPAIEATNKEHFKKKLQKGQMTLGPQNIRDKSERTEMAILNRVVLGDKQYNDENLLYENYFNLAV